MKNHKLKSFELLFELVLTDIRFAAADMPARGIILTMLARLYKNPAGLPTNTLELCKILAIDEQLLSNCLPIVEQVFYKKNNRYFCTLIDDFFAHEKVISETYRKNALKSVEARKNKAVSAKQVSKSGGLNQQFNNCSTIAQQSLYARAQSKEKERYNNIILSLYNLYPKKKGKKRALIAIRKALTELSSTEEKPVDFLKSKLQAYAKVIATGNKRFVPYPARWFGEAMYNDDPESWEISPAENPKQNNLTNITSEDYLNSPGI